MALWRIGEGVRACTNKEFVLCDLMRQLLDPYRSSIKGLKC